MEGKNLGVPSLVHKLPQSLTSPPTLLLFLWLESPPCFLVFVFKYGLEYDSLFTDVQGISTLQCPGNGIWG